MERLQTQQIFKGTSCQSLRIKKDQECTKLGLDLVSETGPCESSLEAYSRGLMSRDAHTQQCTQEKEVMTIQHWKQSLKEVPMVI